MTTVSLPDFHHRHDAEVAARFDATEGRFKPDVAFDDARLSGVVRAVGPVDGLRILDLGCGKGRFAVHLARGGAEVVGIDLSAAMLGHAKGIDRAKASAKRLPFADGAFDAVIAVEVLEHVGDVRPVLEEARRVLRPGGRLAIVDKNLLALDANRPWLPSVLIKWVDQKRGRWMYPSGGPVVERWFAPKWLRTEIEHAGFAKTRVEFLLTPRESRRFVFRAIPATRLLTLWSASVAVSSDPESKQGAA